MRFLSWLVGLPLAAVIVVFAISNRQAATVGLWPLDRALTAPLYLVVLAPLVVGLILGTLLGGAGTIRARWEARSQARRAAELERAVANLRTPALPAIAPPSAPPAARK